MKHSFKILALLASVLILAGCEKPDNPAGNDNNGSEDNTPKERVIYYTVGDNESHRNLETEAEWDALLDQLCDQARNGNEVTFYNIDQTTYYQSNIKGASKENRTISTIDRDEIKSWMKEMERQGLTVHVTYNEGSGTWHGEAYTTAPANNTAGEIIGTWRFNCMVVTQVGSDGHLLGSDLYEPMLTGGTMSYTFSDNGTVTLTMLGMDGTTATESGSWSLSDDGVLSSDLMPNGVNWNVNWITSNTMILSHNDVETDGGETHYQLQFDRI